MSTTPLSAMAEAALAFASTGTPVFPLCWPVFSPDAPDGKGVCRCGKGHEDRDIGKAPLTPHGFKDATTDEVVIRARWRYWPEANIGIPTGAVSGRIVLDVDPRHGGDVALAALEAEHGALPDTVEVLTGGGGRHLVFQYPGFKVGNSAGSSTGKLPPGLDIRGDGGYVVAPPSRHRDGSERWYTWKVAHHPADIALAPAPEWLLTRLKGARRNGPRPPAPPIGDTIPDSTRDDTLTSLGGTMRRRAMSENAIAAALLVENAERCDPPLPESQVRKIAHSVARYEPAAPGTDHPCTDLGNAERLADRHGADLRYVRPWSRWHVWDGVRWVEDRTGQAERWGKHTVRAIYDEAQACTDDERRGMLAKHAVRSEGAPRLEAMLTLAKTAPAIAVVPEQFDRDPWLLTVENGTIDLHTGQLREAERGDLITKLAPVRYDEHARCPRWLGYLDTVLEGDPERITFLQRAVGYSLTGSTRERVFIILHGSGRNGKSTFVSTVRRLMGDYAESTPSSTFLERPRGAVLYALDKLQGVRFVAAVETREGDHLSEETIKAVTGNDYLPARKIYGDPYSYLPQFTPWMATNHKPVIRGVDRAIWDRIRLVPFNLRLTEQEEDKALAGALVRELPGILNWAIAGCLAWQREGLGLPQAVQHATDTYQEQQDVLGVFLAECCTVAPTATCTVAELYLAYTQWAERLNEPPLSHRSVSERMTERGYQSSRGGKGVWYWRGVAVTSPTAPVGYTTNGAGAQ